MSRKEVINGSLQVEDELTWMQHNEVRKLVYLLKDSNQLLILGKQKDKKK